jgi:RNA polymerase sigma-70 factor, ECF subfamily
VTTAVQTKSVAEPAHTASFETVYEENFAFVWRVLRAMGVAEEGAEDAAQEVFVIVHRKLGELDANRSVRAWLFTIASNVARNARRSVRRKGVHATLDETIPATTPDQGEALDSRRELENVFAVIGELDDDLAAVLVLTEMESMTAPEIAAVLECNLNTVYARQRRARARFQEAYAKRSKEPR